MGGASFEDTGRQKEKQNWRPEKQLIGNYGGKTIYRVDGPSIRRNLDDQFTNYAGHSRYDWIPEGEIWVDKSVHPAEMPIFIDRAVHEDRWAQEGKSASKINELGDRYQTAERKKVFGVKATQKGVSVDPRIKQIPSGTKRIRVFLVDGEKIRNHARSDQQENFTEGGNNGPYKWVPRNDIWIESGMQPEEMGFTALHELHERRQMLGAGKDYLSAHASASTIEHKARENPKLLQPLLRAELAANDIT